MINLPQFCEELSKPSERLLRTSITFHFVFSFSFVNVLLLFIFRTFFLFCLFRYDSA